MRVCMAVLMCVMILFSPLAAHAKDRAKCDLDGGVQLDENSKGKLKADLSGFLSSSSKASSIIHFEGLLPHQGGYDASYAAVSELPQIRKSILLWCSGGGQDYYTAAERKFMKWVGVYKPSYNPIDESVFDAFFDSYYVMRKFMLPAETEIVDNFIKHWAVGYVTQMRDAQMRGEKGVWINNWQSHRVKIITLIALDLNDVNLLNDAQSFFRGQVSYNISNSGETLDFKERDAINYVNYDIDPLLRSAIAAAKMGRDWFNWISPNGGSLAKSVEWLVPYVDGRLSHQEYANSKVHLDMVKRSEGVAGFNGTYAVIKSADVFWHAAQLNKDYKRIAVNIRNTPPDDLYFVNVK